MYDDTSYICYYAYVKVVTIMAIKSANVAARVEPDIKERAEGIMNQLGIPASTAINMFYRQIIYCNGMPFRPALPQQPVPIRDEMTKEEFDARMAVGCAQAKADRSSPAEEVFKRLRSDNNEKK